MVAEEIVVSLSGGSPWGFRLQGGREQQKPLQVAKVRRRSKACRAGLKEHDELVAIGDHICDELSHAQAMSLIDTQSSTLNLRVKRAPPGFHSSSYAGRSGSPRSSLKVLSPPAAPLKAHRSSVFSPTETPGGITSPPDSEAYYGETDSDADTQSHTHRRQRRTPPHARSPARYDNQEEEETSEMSGYESANDAGVSLQAQREPPCLAGVPRRDFIYQPLQTEWTVPAHTLHALTPTPDQGLAEAEGEGDSGFQEAGGCVGMACPPLVSPERAREALMLGSGNQLVPMVGPQMTPLSDELSATYMDKARQAKLQRGESLVEKQVKEARTKCRSIASLLTDAPNPNSKGVLMFKKRRQRAKKYTLTCFGKAEGDGGGETEGETEEEGGSSILSGSEVDEDGFSGSFDPTWDSGYLDVLDRRSSACPSTTPTSPTTPTTNSIPGLDILSPRNLGRPVDLSPGVEASEPDGSAYQGSRLDNSVANRPISSPPAMSPPAAALTNGGSVAVSRASVVLSPPSQTPSNSQNGFQNSDLHLNANPSPNPSCLNRTARPFAAGPSPSRGTVTSVMFRPPQPKSLAVNPATAVSMVTLTPTHYTSQPDTRRAVSSTSLYIPPRNNHGNAPPPGDAPPAPTFAPTFAPRPQPPTPPVHVPPFSPPSCPSAGQPFPPPAPQPVQSPPPQMHPPVSAGVSTLHIPPPPLPPTQPLPSLTVHPCANTAADAPPGPQAAPADSLATREQRISVPAARTGILQDARSRGSKKPMFCSVQKQDVSPNPALLSMVQNMDDRFGRPAGGESASAPGGETGHESGPEEDWLRLGAEACNFMQAQRGPRPPPVAPKPQTPQVPELAGKGGHMFARRQNRMDRYVVDRSPSVAAVPYSPAQTREPSPTPSLPAAWKYSSNIRAPPPISYNPLLSPSCPLKAQKKSEVAKPKTSAGKGQKAGIKPVDIMGHQPYQLMSSLFTYGGGVPQDASQQQRAPEKTARVYEVKRFSTPPPTATGPTPKVIAPRSATTLGEPLWRSETTSPPPSAGPVPYRPQTPAAHYQTQWAVASAPHRPAPAVPLPRLPTFSAPMNPVPDLQPSPASARQFKSAPDLSPARPGGPQQAPGSAQLPRVPRPRFSTSNLGLQPCVWRPGSAAH